MSGEAVWHDVCPICAGRGKIETLNRKLKKLEGPTPCEACGGTGRILVVKKIRKGRQ